MATRIAKVKHECVGQTVFQSIRWEGWGWSRLPKGPLARHQTSIGVTRLAPESPCYGEMTVPPLVPPAQVILDQQIYVLVSAECHKWNGEG